MIITGHMQKIIQIYPCLFKLSCKQESVTDGRYYYIPHRYRGGIKSDEIPFMCNILLYLRDIVNNAIFLLFFHHENHTIKLISFWCFRDLSYSEESNYRYLSYTHKPVGALSATFYTILTIIKTLIEHIWSLQCILESFSG